MASEGGRDPPRSPMGWTWLHSEEAFRHEHWLPIRMWTRASEKSPSCLWECHLCVSEEHQKQSSHINVRVGECKMLRRWSHSLQKTQIVRPLFRTDVQLKADSSAAVLWSHFDARRRNGFAFVCPASRTTLSCKLSRPFVLLCVYRHPVIICRCRIDDTSL